MFRLAAIFFFCLTCFALAQPPVHFVATRDGRPDFEVNGTQVICGGQKLTAQVEKDRLKLFSGAQVVLKLKRKDDGFEMEDGGGVRLLRVKPRSDGFKVVDAQDHEVCALKYKGSELKADSGRLSAAGGGLDWTENGKVRAHLQGSQDLKIGLGLALGSLTPPQRAALTLFVSQLGI
ncbi:hypothetical protein JST97_27100 [bacterium]|nr:hypothetical protein [bacterium]